MHRGRFQKWNSPTRRKFSHFGANYDVKHVLSPFGIPAWALQARDSNGHRQNYGQTVNLKLHLNLLFIVFSSLSVEVQGEREHSTPKKWLLYLPQKCCLKVKIKMLRETLTQPVAIIPI